MTPQYITWLTLALVFLVSACGSTYDSSRIREPDGDLITDRVAEGPDGKNHELSGGASWYGEPFHGRTTASGETYDMYRFTAAHKTLPFHTVVRVTEPESRKSVVVRITDRGPYHGTRIIDLSYAAAKDLNLLNDGVQHVELEIVQWGDGSRVRAD